MGTGARWVRVVWVGKCDAHCLPLARSLEPSHGVRHRKHPTPAYSCVRTRIYFPLHPHAHDLSVHPSSTWTIVAVKPSGRCIFQIVGRPSCVHSRLDILMRSGQCGGLYAQPSSPAALCSRSAGSNPPMPAPRSARCICRRRWYIPLLPAGGLGTAGATFHGP
ncbi:hypothetical protein BJ912DRAFT_89771 [Pholiota molesta]|nr:hypothetical protein BJ912DRAFT_89771 [Pholiota molesta]